MLKHRCSVQWSLRDHCLNYHLIDRCRQLRLMMVLFADTRFARHGYWNLAGYRAFLALQLDQTLPVRRQIRVIEYYSQSR